MLLDAVQGPTHAEGHPVGALHEQDGEEHMDDAQAHDAHETDLQPRTDSSAVRHQINSK